jgi:hypothetical protein
VPNRHRDDGRSKLVSTLEHQYKTEFLVLMLRWCTSVEIGRRTRTCSPNFQQTTIKFV